VYPASSCLVGNNDPEMPHDDFIVGVIGCWPEVESKASHHVNVNYVCHTQISRLDPPHRTRCLSNLKKHQVRRTGKIAREDPSRRLGGSSTPKQRGRFCRLAAFVLFFSRMDGDGHDGDVLDA
jgi:hypothetical protein